MRRLTGLGFVLAIATAAHAATYTNEVLVLASAATRVDTGLSLRKGIEVQNLGPNAIYCSVHESSAAVVTKARKVDASGGAWAIDLGPQWKVYCRAATADQVTGAATVVTEVR